MLDAPGSERAVAAFTPVRVVTNCAHVGTLRSSVTRLRDLASTISEAELTGRAYPAGWSIAQVLSHLGSGAVIMQRRLEDTIAGQATPDDFAPGVWNTWNAKAPAGQRDDAVTADTALLARIEAVTPGEREAFTFGMGPMTFGFGQFVGLRLNEHAFHTWDIEVAVDPAATIPRQVAGARRRQPRADRALHRQTHRRHDNHHRRHHRPATQLHRRPETRLRHVRSQYRSGARGR